MVAGDASATTGQDTSIVSWVCSRSGGSPLGPFKSPSEANCETRDPDNIGLGVHVDFPSCWDGKLNNHTVDGNTADYKVANTLPNHLVYPTGYPAKTGTCPATHPRKLSHLRLDVRWSGCDNTRPLSWACESDNFELSSGGQFSMHADFLMGWTDAGQRDQLLACINTSTAHPHGGSSKCGS